MTEKFLTLLDLAVLAINVAAVVVIVGGFAIVTLRYALRLRKLSRSRNFARFKIEFEHALILGLEILILAQLIETIIVTPTLQSLAYLAAIVVVRTVLNWSLILEIEGRWPWQSAADEEEMHV
jgi:uncharacterized membrane protein